MLNNLYSFVSQDESQAEAGHDEGEQGQQVTFLGEFFQQH
jgi:hypothetical protein